MNKLNSKNLNYFRNQYFSFRTWLIGRYNVLIEFVLHEDDVQHVSDIDLVLRFELIDDLRYDRVVQ
jgi:hypothetical protein